MNKEPHRIKILESNENNFLVEVNETKFKVKVKKTEHNKIGEIEVNGNSFQISVERTQASSLQVKIGEKLFQVEIRPKILKGNAVKFEPTALTRKPVLSLPREKNFVVAPITGKIVSFKASVGQIIEKGECICILEAMKMQNEVNAIKAGIIKEIKVFEGAIVNKGDILAVIS